MAIGDVSGDSGSGHLNTGAVLTVLVHFGPLLLHFDLGGNVSVPRPIPKALPKPAPLSICVSPPGPRRGCGRLAWQQAEQSAARVEDLTLRLQGARGQSLTARMQVHLIHARLAEATGRAAGRVSASRLTKAAVARFGLGAGAARRQGFAIGVYAFAIRVLLGSCVLSREAGAALVAREAADRRGAVVLPRYSVSSRGGQRAHAWISCTAR